MSLDFLRRDVSHLPLVERGHQHRSSIHDVPLRAEQGGFVHEGETTWHARPEIYAGVFSCHWCDTFPHFQVRLDEDGEPARIEATTDCPLPRGMTFVNDLAVPSGRIIVADDLRPIYDVPLVDEVDVPGYNSIAGQDLHCTAMAEIGVAFGPVGNTGPSLIRIGPDRYVIASVDEEAEPGEDGYFAGDRLASICTDLHAYSIADYEHWLARVLKWTADPARRDPNDWDRLGLVDWVCSGADPDALPWHVSVVDITPGVYRFTHHTGEPDFDRDGWWPLIFADVEKIG